MTVPQLPTVHEQLMLELLNRIRTNPAGEFDTLIANLVTPTAVQSNITDAIAWFGVDLVAFRSQMAAYSPVAPLAWNSALALAAERHTALMITHDTQSHQLPGEAGLGARISAAGYANWTSVAENIYAYSQDPLHAHAGFVVDWGYDAEDFSGGTLRSNWRTLGDGMQDPAGHRMAIMRAATTEAGLDLTVATGAALSVGPFLVTQNFGTRSDYKAQLVGVVIADADQDRFYDIGEGLAAVTITATGAAGTFVTTSWGSGGYQMELPRGSYSVSFDGAPLGGSATYSVSIGSHNVKLDAFSQDALRDLRLIGTGTADRLTGHGGNDAIYGDGFIAAYTPDQAMAVYRIYQAALGRVPDGPGQAAWASHLADGTRTLDTVAAGFVGSAEFARVYGALDNRAFVALLYDNVLERAPDAAGLTGWTGLLAGGTSRAEVVLGFSQSAEFTLRTQAAASAFTQARNEAGWVDDVYRLYQATLGRAPDATGFSNWTGFLADGTRTLDTVAAGFVGSTEFARFYGALDNRAFVALLYDNVLERAPDATGLTAWTGLLAGGTSRAEVVLGFSQSAEFVNATATATKGWIRSLGPHDEIAGGGGTNTLYGGKLADIFVFETGAPAHHRIMDMEAWDWLSFRGFGYDVASAARTHMTQTGTDVVFQDQDVTVTLADTRLSALTDDMFLFG